MKLSGPAGLIRRFSGNSWVLILFTGKALFFKADETGTLVGWALQKIKRRLARVNRR
jgi:hypothetical protein